jgi:adenine-specific DNA-methyltransferase
VIKYLGSKRELIPHIMGIVRTLEGVRTACDLFAGTTRIGQALKKMGLHVISNDTASYSEVLGRCYIETDAGKVRLRNLESILRDLAKARPREGWFTKTYCRDARYFQPKNGKRIEAVRNRIEKMELGEPLRSIVLTSLMEAADRVDSTTGLQMAYLKSWAPRSLNPLGLRAPELLTGRGEVYRKDANELARELDNNVDLVYIDPPYNQHSYFSNYHVWETLVRWDKPEVYGKARKRVDCRTQKSDYNSKKKARAAFQNLLANLRAKHVLVSFNNEGFISFDEMASMLKDCGRVEATEIDYKRYVGARIGIYNPSGEKVGKISHLRNKEYLFLVSRNRRPVETAGRDNVLLGELPLRESP